MMREHHPTWDMFIITQTKKQRDFDKNFDQLALPTQSMTSAKRALMWVASNEEGR